MKYNKVRMIIIQLMLVAVKTIFVVIKLPLFLFFYLSGFIKRDNEKWVFSSWEGKYFRGNCKYFFEYVSQRKYVNAIWLTKSYKLYKALKKDNINVLYMFSPQGIYALSKAKNVFVSHGVLDVLPYFVRGANIVSLGHVVSPIKMNSVTEAAMKLPFIHKVKLYVTDPYSHMNLITYEVVSSCFTRNSVMFMRNTKNNRNRILTLGLPKTDYQLSISKTCRSKIFNNVLSTIVPDSLSDQKIILFLPTWRDDVSFSIFNEGFDSIRLNNVLTETQSILLINFHPFDKSSKLMNNLAKTEPRIFLTSVGGDNITNLLCSADIFITDYSSLYSDFLLYDRPMIFAKFSHKDYIKERSLKFNYDTLPGEKVLNWYQLEDAIKNEMVMKEDKYSTNRKKLRQLIYDGNDDGLSSFRIYKYFLDLNRTGPRIH